jgi:hypothetical protein
VKNAKIIFVLSLILASFAIGCASTEPDNVSERPWNAPKGWENGLPGGMTPHY